MTPKLSQNKMSELKETKKMKVVQLHEYTPEQFLNPSPTPTSTKFQLSFVSTPSQPNINPIRKSASVLISMSTQPQP